MTQTTDIGKIIIFTAPSGAGKSTLLEITSKRFDNCLPTISHTSRTKRLREIDGQHYHFKSSEEFKQLIKKEYFLEWEEVYNGDYYGTSKNEFPRIWNLGKIPLMDVDIQGALNIKKMYGENVFIIGVDVPGKDILERLELLEIRLLNRGENKEKIKSRLAKASTEFDLMLHTEKEAIDLIVINDMLSNSEKIVCNAIVEFLSVSA
ncbi:guanylate kinase [Candidatus Nomurabacteria bacterium]|nr:guanylate kinase [Candidatus Nomurabacteria bacterium]